MSTGTEEIPKVVIVVFEDSVSKETIDKYADDVVANGGKIKDRYYQVSEGKIYNGFSAYIKYFDSFKTFRADEINYIEADKEFKTQAS